MKVNPIDVCWLLVDNGSTFSPETNPLVTLKNHPNGDTSESERKHY